MPVYKDKQTNTWFVQIRYKDFNGHSIQKKKRGFKTKKKALEYESRLKDNLEGSLSMIFKDFIDVYLEDMKHRWKPTTYSNRISKIKNWITPYLGEKYLNQITVIDIRRWQNIMNEAGLSETTMHKTHSILSAIFNYAVNFFDLKENPCKKAGPVGSSKREATEFWTLEEFKEFISYVNDPSYRTAYNTLYYTGLRIGELLALTPEDIDFETSTINITKNYQIVDGREIILTPKTKKSVRSVKIPENLQAELRSFINTFYSLNDSDRIFIHHKSSYGNELRKICDRFELKKIRIHDFRHSHASLLIELGFSPLLIAERLGHDDISVTLNTYSHLYPSKQNELVTALNKLF